MRFGKRSFGQDRQAFYLEPQSALAAIKCIRSFLGLAPTGGWDRETSEAFSAWLLSMIHPAQAGYDDRFYGNPSTRYSHIFGDYPNSWAQIVHMVIWYASVGRDVGRGSQHDRFLSATEPLISCLGLSLDRSESYGPVAEALRQLEMEIIRAERGVGPATSSEGASLAFEHFFLWDPRPQYDKSKSALESAVPWIVTVALVVGVGYIAYKVS